MTVSELHRPRRSKEAEATASVTIEGDTFGDGGDDVERRDFLRVAGTAAVGAFLPWKAWPLPDGSLDLDDLVSITTRYCRLAPAVSSATLLEAMLAHLRRARDPSRFPADP